MKHDLPVTHADMTTHADMATQLERLVCGELDEAARAPLIAWLDAEPGRWRLCGLLFLEAQTWSQALAEWPAAAESVRRPTAAVAACRSRGRWRRTAEIAALAASILVAFVLGAATQHRQVGRDAPTSAVDDGARANSADSRKAVKSDANPSPVMAMLPTASRAGMPVPALHIPVIRSSEAGTASSGGDDAISDYVRQQWARRGYRLDVERRYLFARLPSGQQVAVPFEQYSIQPIPPKIN
jgi:hypothetical protein